MLPLQDYIQKFAETYINRKFSVLEDCFIILNVVTTLKIQPHTTNTTREEKYRY